MITRATLEQSNDDPKLQEVDVNLSHGEKARGVEHVQPYGFSSNPVAPSKESDGSTKRAEAIVAHADGSRSHPVVLMVSDRRFRPKGLQKGESIQHDDQDQKVHIKRDGIEISTTKKITFKVGTSTVVIDAGSITFRAAAIKFEQA